MKLLSVIHRWTGAFIGILLAILGLTGAILVWESEWVRVPGAHDPVRENAAAIGTIVERAAAGGNLSRVTFASDEIGLHQLVYADGSGAYVRQTGEVAARWTSQWERPELWLFDLHHHLFAGHTGETVTGVAGIAGLLFVITGVILWWRSRRSFAPRLLPKTFAPGSIVKHHRDLGLILSPLLTLSMLTGVTMIFEPLRVALLGVEERPKANLVETGQVGVREAIVRSKELFPEAALRRVSLPAKPGGPIVVRMRQPLEWTPNGRTQLSFAADGSISVENAAAANRAASISEKLYPVHTAKAGGLLMKLLMTMSGLGLFALGSLATYSFWARKSAKRRSGRPRSVLAGA